MKTLDELDALHAAATAGEWVVRSYQEPSGEYSPAPTWDPYDEDNLVLVAALHNAWPEVSARLRAAEALVAKADDVAAKALARLKAQQVELERLRRLCRVPRRAGGGGRRVGKRASSTARTGR